jgi:hypothetical protein
MLALLAGALDNAAEFEPTKRALLYSCPALDVVESASRRRAVQFDAELRAFTRNRREARMLGYDDFVAASKKGRINSLVGSSVLEQGRDMYSGLMGKNIGAHYGLRAADVTPRRASDDLRQCLQFPGVDIGATARDMTKRHDDFLKRGVPRAFAQSKHCH